MITNVKHARLKLKQESMPCGVARDVWAGCLARLQKCVGDQVDML